MYLAFYFMGYRLQKPAYRECNFRSDYDSRAYFIPQRDEKRAVCKRLEAA